MIAALAAGDVDVWRTPLSVAEGEIARFRALLDPGEQERAQRLRREADRRRFIVARGRLRLTLARYLDADPRELRFGNAGKPRLPGLAFSTSRSGDLALIAVARRAEIGVDVEHAGRGLDTRELGPLTLTAAERADVDSRAPADRSRRWLELWVRKEAYLKALGVGLARDPRTVETCRLDGGGLLRDADGRTWAVVPLAPSPHHVGCVVAAGTELNVRWRSRADHELTRPA